MKKFLVVFALLLLPVGVNAQKKIEKVAVEVDGVCSMCKARIEKASFSEKGVKSASWSVEDHQLTLIYDASKTSIDSIQKKVSLAGHNTPLFKAPEEAYQSLPMCCKYRTVSDH